MWAALQQRRRRRNNNNVMQTLLQKIGMNREQDDVGGDLRALAARTPKAKGKRNRGYRGEVLFCALVRGLGGPTARLEMCVCLKILLELGVDADTSCW